MGSNINLKIIGYSECPNCDGQKCESCLYTGFVAFTETDRYPYKYYTNEIMKDGKWQRILDTRE